MRETLLRLLALVTLLVGAATAAAADSATPPRDGRHPATAGSFNLTVPTQSYDLILARPERSSVALSVLAYRDLEAVVAYGTSSGVYSVQMPVRLFKSGEPAEVSLDHLQPDTAYCYRLRFRVPGTEAFVASPEYTFHTARPADRTFTFTMTADAHLDEHTSPEVYLRTLANITADRPDFHLDLGNLFMTDKHKARDEATRQYLAERYYLARIGPNVPVLLALGVHDGEAAREDDGSATCLAAWSNRMRERYFPNPVPDAFYSGNAAATPSGALLQNYYAWTWGDALFVVLDPFRYSSRQRNADGWGWSLGAAQYQWLRQTLEQSRARFKFVFLHNLLCGDQASRGGVEVAGFNEWGGKNRDGSDGFKDHRPGWEMPIHQLLLRHHVAAVFKAHDNFFARQEFDGIVYQMVPQPSFAGTDRIRDLENYGYKEGTFLGNAGHIRVTVSPEKVRVEYVRVHLPQEATKDHPNGEIIFSYEIAASRTTLENLR